MKNYLLIVTTCFFLTSAFSQTSKEKTGKKFVPSIATVQTINGTKTKGWFYKMNDESLYLLPVKQNRKYLQTSEFTGTDINSGSIAIQASQVKSIALMKRNAGLKGALIGLGVGVATGAIIGFVSGDDPVTPYTGTVADLFIGIGNAFAMTAGEKAAAGALGLGVMGGITGFILGKVAKKKFIIGGQKDTYRDMQGELMKRLIIK
jgi:hypothetical protein